MHLHRTYHSVILAILPSSFVAPRYPASTDFFFWFGHISPLLCLYTYLGPNYPTAFTSSEWSSSASSFGSSHGTDRPTGIKHTSLTTPQCIFLAFCAELPKMLRPSLTNRTNTCRGPSSWLYMPSYFSRTARCPPPRGRDTVKHHS